MLKKIFGFNIHSNLFIPSTMGCVSRILEPKTWFIFCVHLVYFITDNSNTQLSWIKRIDAFVIQHEVFCDYLQCNGLRACLKSGRSWFDRRSVKWENFK